MSWPSKKALWVLETIVGRINFKKLAKTFDTNLYMTLHKLMGLKSQVLTRFLIVGMSTIYVELMPLLKRPSFNNFNTIEIISSPIICQ